MTKTLEEAEASCLVILDILDASSKGITPAGEVADFEKRVRKIRDEVFISKGKIMMRSAKGKELAQRVRDEAIKLERLIKEKLANQGEESVLAQLNKLESETHAMSAFWKAFEGTIT